MDVQAFLKKNNLCMVEDWLQKVEQKCPGKFNLTEMKMNGVKCLSLFTDTHVPLEEHPKYNNLMFICENQAVHGTPIEDIIQISNLWREVILDYSYKWMEMETIHGAELLLSISKRMDQIQNAIMNYYVKATKNIKEQYKIKEFHEDRLNVLGKMAASMAHELKNPLFAIEGFLKLIRNELSSESLLSVGTYMDVIEREFKGLYANISSFLAFSKNSSIEEEYAHCKLNDLIDTVVRLVRPRLVDENIKLQLQMKQEMTVEVQKIGMQQVLSNLINNSIDALTQVTYPKKMMIKVWEEKIHYFIQIMDNGPGIPNEVKEKLFEPFVTNKKNGTGLGLSICKQIVQKNDGTITFHSKRGKTVFVIGLKKDRFLTCPTDHLAKKVI